MTQYTLHPNLLTEKFDGELIIHDLDSGKTLLLNQSAAIIIDYLQAGSSILQITKDLANNYNLPSEVITNEINVLVAELVREGMVLKEDKP